MSNFYEYRSNGHKIIVGGRSGSWTVVRVDGKDTPGMPRAATRRAAIQAIQHLIERQEVATNQQALAYANGDYGFATWLTLVAGSVNRRLGVSLFDLEDPYPLREAYDNGESPIETAIEIALEQGWEG